MTSAKILEFYGLGLRPGDRYFCPSSPAWEHGLAHGTISPLALGIRTASYSGTAPGMPNRRPV
jgi:acetyl-CoA synthetase